MTTPRPVVAEEKAALVLELHRLCRVIPWELSEASIQQTDAWRARIKVGRSVKGNPHASMNELRKAIDLMRRPFPQVGKFSEEFDYIAKNFGHEAGKQEAAP